MDWMYVLGTVLTQLLCTVRSFYWADGYDVLVHTIYHNNTVWGKMMNRFIFDKSFDRLTCEWDLMLNYRVATTKWFIFNITRYRELLVEHVGQEEYTGGQSPYFIPTKDDICFIWLVVAWYTYFAVIGCSRLEG